MSLGGLAFSASSDSYASCTASISTRLTKVRWCEERSDELEAGRAEKQIDDTSVQLLGWGHDSLRSSLCGTPASYADTSLRNVAAANSAAASNFIKTTFFATRFACRSCLRPDWLFPRLRHGPLGSQELPRHSEEQGESWWLGVGVQRAMCTLRQVCLCF